MTPVDEAKDLGLAPRPSTTAMTRRELESVVMISLNALVERDHTLFVRDISERCLAARWMLHLQSLVPGWDVDVEFNREGDEQDPKQLGIDPKCANRQNANGLAYVVPDLIVHRRGPKGPNVFVAEIKKTTNRQPRDCDHRRISAFLERFGYCFGAIVELETRRNHHPSASVVRWFGT